MLLKAVKYIGAGLATIGLAGTVVSIGNIMKSIFSSFII